METRGANPLLAYLHACQSTWTCCVKATVASSSEIWPKAVELRLVNAMRLFTLRIPVAPQGDQITAAVGTVSDGQRERWLSI